jgi:serine/threonine-protein kinase RsbT
VWKRVGRHPAAEDLIQETMLRVLAAAPGIEQGTLEPYTIVTAKHVIASMWRQDDRDRRNQHRLLDPRAVDAPDEGLMVSEQRTAMATALQRLSPEERASLVEHELLGRDTHSMADEAGSTPGAVAARLNRARARLRVEYLLAVEGQDPVTGRCRPVLYALSVGDRRRQREVDAGTHLLECELCARLSVPLLERSQSPDHRVRISVGSDSDIVAARRAARALAADAGFGRTEQTVIATAVSEITRNIVRFATRGEVLIEMVLTPRRGVRIVARDEGPGIPDVARALEDGYSTYDGLGLGLPGARRLMDQFDITSETGRGTTVTMIRWLQEG